MSKKAYFENIFFNAGSGRSPEEQLTYIERYAIHGVPNTLRSFQLMDMGLSEPAPQAENVVLLGCYPPFMDRARIISYFKLLDALEVDHTYLEREYCCGVHALRQIKDPEAMETALEACRSFVNRNKAAADEKSAATLAYYCVGCAHTVHLLDRDDADRHVYALDLIIPALNKRALKLPPTRAAYFEGCHTRYEALRKNFSLDWEKYRRTLDEIEGLTVVDLPNNVCCTRKPDYIVSMAKEQGLDTLICSCCGCAGSLSMSSDKAVKIKYLPEVILEALQD